jgi:hypothetical protein
MYGFGFDNVAITAVQDLISMLAGGRDIRIHQFDFWQTSDLGDAQEEVLRFRMRQGQTTVGSGGGAATIVPEDVDDSAALTTARVNDTTQASAGTIVTNDFWGMNIRAPVPRIWTPELRPVVKQGRRCTIELVGAPLDSLTCGAFLQFSEG